MGERDQKSYYQLTDFQKSYVKIKYGVDVILAAIGILVLSFLFLGIIIAIKIEDGIKAPVLFSQKRVGLHKKHFKLYKFRSMKLDTPHDTPTHLLENPEQYITKVGKFLRKTSLDELPQLWNIVCGDMAVIGPRPALFNQFDLIKERDRYGVHQIKPGLTGWAQIHGRDELEIEEKAKLDGYYLRHLGPLIDIRSFFGTIHSVLKSDGVVEGGTGKLHAQESAQKKGKILIMTNHSFMLWQFRRELISELLKEKEVILSMPCGEHTEDFKRLGCTVMDTPVDRRGMNPVTDFGLFRHYLKILKEIKPDKVITYSIKPNIYGGAASCLLRIPYYVNVQGLGTAFQKKGLAEIVSFMYWAALRKAEVVFFENEGNAAEFRKRGIILKNRQKVLHGAGINLNYYSYEPYLERRKVENETEQGSMESEEICFLFVGRIMKEKGVDELFEAAKQMKKTYGERVRFDLVGFFEDEYKEIVGQLQQKGIVVFHGFKQEVRPYYARANCIVLPSYHEGMSNVLLEAAATGRALITTDIPGCREAVEDGKSGYLCKVKSSKDLVKAMTKFVELSPSEREEMGRAGRLRMEKLFDKKIVVAETMDALGL